MAKVFGWSEDNVSLTALRDRQNQPTDGLDVLDRVNALAALTNTVVVGTSGSTRLTLFTPTRTVTVSQITTSTTSTAAVLSSATGLNARMGLYTVASNGSLTLVAQTASDSTLWIAANTQYTRSFDTTGGYPASYTLVAGTRYAAGYNLYASGGTLTSPTIAGASIVGQLGSLAPIMGYVATSGSNSQSLPTAPTSSPSSSLPWVRLTT